MKSAGILKHALRTATSQPQSLQALPLLRPTSLPRSSRLPSCRIHSDRSFSHASSPRAAAASKSIYTSGTACPSCGAPLPPVLSPLCPSCSQLLPPPPPATTYFALFRLDPVYALDTRALKRTFLELQQKVHPDMFSGKGQVEEWAKAWSGKVNDAYKALVNERERAEYLLSLHGVTIGEADPVTDPELLMTIMEVREALEDAQTEEEVAQIRQRNQDSRTETVAQLSSVLASSSSPDLERARMLTIELKYLDNIDQVCREWTPGASVPNLQH